MTVKTKSISRSISRPITNKIVSDIFNPQVRGQTAPINPWDIEGLQHRGLDESTFNDSTVYSDAGSVINTFKWYLRDRSTSDTRIPRQGRCYTFTGAEYISVPGLIGSETVDFKEGTGTVSISAGRIDVTAGTLWNLTLSNGSVYLCNEEDGYTAYDIVNGNHGTIVGGVLASIHTASSTITNNPNNDEGYTTIENYCASTEDFSTTSWTKTDTTVTPNNTTAPNGTNTGNLVQEGSTNTAQLIFSVTQGTANVYTNLQAGWCAGPRNLSIYLKAGTATWIRFGIATGGNQTWQYVNLSTGTLGQLTAPTSSSVPGAVNNVNISNEGSGWYRVSIAITSPATFGLAGIAVYTAQGDGNTSRVVNGNYYAWGAQITIGTELKPYVPNLRNVPFNRKIYIPKKKNINTSAIDTALEVTGRCSYSPTIQTKCWTADTATSVINTGVVLPATADFTISFWMAQRVLAAIINNIIDIGTSGVGRLSLTTGTGGIYRLLLPRGTGSDFVSGLIGSNSAPTLNRWQQVIIQRTSNVFSLSIGGRFCVQTGSPDPTAIAATPLRLGNTGLVGGSISYADLRITTSGVTTYIPLQDGPGTSGNNRNISWVDSNGNGDVIPNAISGGTPATQWANYVTGEVKDWCVQYGGGTAPNGAFVPGHISGGNTATGVPKSLVPGKFGNPWSQIDFNPDLAAEFNGRSIPRTWKIGDTFPGTITPSNAAFLRSKADGVDRLFIYESTLTGKNLESVENYIA